MLVTLAEAKGYLRVDSSDDDGFIKQLLQTAEGLVLDVSRLTVEELEQSPMVTRTALLYAVAYLYEHRENANHKDLIETLKYLLFSVRKEAF